MPALTLLNIPVEIRLRLYNILFVDKHPIQILATIPAQPGDEDCWDLERCSLSSQFLRACKQILNEGLMFLYTYNVFDCSTREGLKLLMHNIGPKNCSMIKHLVLDWDQLQDFAWLLAKEEYVVATSGLQTLQSVHWRNRVTQRASVQWRNIKSYERQLYEAALDIITRHRNLNILVEQPCRRSGPLATTIAKRVKWKFVASIANVASDDTVVDIRDELTYLALAKDEIINSEGSLMIDPF